MFIPLWFHSPVKKETRVFVMGKQMCILWDQDVSFAVEVERSIDQSTNVFSREAEVSHYFVSRFNSILPPRSHRSFGESFYVSLSGPR